MSANKRELTQMYKNKKISERVIGCAMAVSNALGAGFLESVYENALSIELDAEGIHCKRQYPLKVKYKDKNVGNYITDFIIEDKLIVELKALSKLTSEHEAQVINYLKATSIRAGLLINFGTPRLGIKRIVLDYDDEEKI